MWSWARACHVHFASLLVVIPYLFMVICSGAIKVADELCDPDLASTDFGWNIHSPLPGYSPAVVSPLPSMAPFLMDPPFPVFKYLAVNYRLRGAMPTELCRHNAMVRVGPCSLWRCQADPNLCCAAVAQVADAVGSAELSHLWRALAVICSLPANKPSMTVDHSMRIQHTLSMTEESASPKDRGGTLVLRILSEDLI